MGKPKGIISGMHHIMRTIMQKIYINLFYPGCVLRSPVTFWAYVFPQKILNLNGSRSCPWPVHYTSFVGNPERIKILGPYTAPGRSPLCYIQAINGLVMGENIYIGPGVKIISANHDVDNFLVHVKTRPIVIGDNCWLGANSVILAGVEVGDHVIVSAGSVVTHDFPSNCIVAGVPAKIIKQIEPYPADSI